MKYKPGEVFTFETSWLGEETCGSLRALLTHRLFVRSPVLMEAWGEAGSGVALFLEADGGRSGWLCVVVFPELPELECSRLNSVPSLEFSSVEVCEGNTNMLKALEREMKLIKAWINLHANFLEKE
jgi:hypothetical protein